MRQIGIDFELPDIMPEEDRLQEQYVMPTLACVLERLIEAGGGRVVTPELPKGLERSEYIHFYDELMPIARFTAAWAYINSGTEEEPDWQLRHVGRIDVMLEETK